MRSDIVLCGVGGQGIVLASRVITAAAMRRDIPVMSAETIGMAQRGGSVFSHLRLGEDVYSPMIAAGTADLILGFEPGEAVRMLPYLKEDGYVVVSDRAVMPVTATLSGANYCAEDMLAYLRKRVNHLLVVDVESACAQLGSPKVLNMLLLGAAIHAGALELSVEDAKVVIREHLPQKIHQINFRALEYFK